MLPEQMNVTCRGSDTQHLAQVVDRRHVRNARRRRSARRSRPLRSPSRPRRCRCRVRRRPPRRASGRRPSAPGRAAVRAAASACATTSALVGSHPSRLAPAMTSKCWSSPKCSRMRRAVGSAFDVATASRTPAARRSASSSRNAVEQGCSSPSRGSCSRRGRRRSPRRRSSRPIARQRLMHRRPDEAAGQVAVGHLGTDLAERVPEAGHDALRRVGQGAVEVEDHQLRPGRRGGVVAGSSRIHCLRRRIVS